MLTDNVVVVTGGRDYLDLSRVWNVLDEVAPTLVIQGGCPSGADEHARIWSAGACVPCLTFYAQWSRYGKRAGPRRNREMFDHDIPIHLCIAFPGGIGTENCILEAERAGVPVRRIE